MALSSSWALGRLHTLKLSPARPCLKAEVGMHALQPSQSSAGTELRPPESSQGVWERFEIGKALSFGVSVLSLAVSVCPAKSHCSPPWQTLLWEWRRPWFGTQMCVGAVWLGQAAVPLHGSASHCQTDPSWLGVRHGSEVMQAKSWAPRKSHEGPWLYLRSLTDHCLAPCFLFFFLIYLFGHVGSSLWDS